MGDVYTAIDMGTDSIKVVVMEKKGKEFFTLASTSVKSSGIREGFITDTKAAVSSVKNAIKRVNDKLGIRISKVIACVPPINCRMKIFSGSWDVIDYEEITGEDVRCVLRDALVERIGEDEEVVTVSPIEFVVDDVAGIHDPKGMPGKVLETKIVVATMDKEALYRILEVLRLSGLETVDIGFSSTGDYYTIKTKKTDEVVGAIINIGEVSTNISIFNKGIQIKNSIVPIGSLNVDRDLSYVFKINDLEARKIKENFAVSMSSYADRNDIMEVTNVDGEKIEINQVGASKIVEGRLREILKFAKNEIKNLTKREIRYIIITGGLSEILGFQYLIDDEFGVEARICNISTMGIRNNKFSSSYGLIKYFDDKLLLRGKSYDMINGDDKSSLMNIGQKVATNDNIINKLFGHFFDN